MVKKISKNNLYKLAQDFKNYVESGKGIPYKFTYDGITYYTLEMTYAVVYGVFHLKSDFEIPNFNWPSKASGDNIVEEVLMDDYKQQCKKVYNYIVKNKQVPNYVTTIKSEKKVNIDLFSYCMAKVLVYYKNNGALPCTCKFDYHSIIPSEKPSLKKYGHATQSGCDNRGQNNGVYCAPHSMQEVIRNLTGKVIPQSTLASWAGTTSGGTGHYGIETAIAKAAKQLGVNLNVRWYHFSELGWDGLNKILNSNNQDCIIHNLYRNSDGHYEVINSISGDTVKVQNSLGGRCSGGCYCGYVENRSTSTFRQYINGISQKSVCVITRS